MRDPASLLNEAKMAKSKKPCQADRLAGLFMVGVARIELATPAMSTQCSTTELYAHAAAASSWACLIIQAYFSSPKLSFASNRSTLRTRPLR